MRRTLAKPDVADRPFALPARELIITTVDLPFPVSTNQLWAYGKRNVRPSAAYVAWKVDADKLGLSQHIAKSKCIEGPFRAELLLREGRRTDCDNCCKAVLDLAQRWNLIANDRYCRELMIKWVATHLAPAGARLTLVELA